jgi:hypothetical protein
VYENLHGDEVGEHIGDIVNDKLQFLWSVICYLLSVSQ